MSFQFNPITGTLDLVNDDTITNIDGGTPDSIYVVSQLVNGGTP